MTGVQTCALPISATGTIPQLGFIHEVANISFPLDMADIFRDEVTIPGAFQAVHRFQKEGREGRMTLEQNVRSVIGRALQEKKVIPRMIDQIKELFHANDGSSDA